MALHEFTFHLINVKRIKNKNLKSNQDLTHLHLILPHAMHLSFSSFSQRSPIRYNRHYPSNGSRNRGDRNHVSRNWSSKYRRCNRKIWQFRKKLHRRERDVSFKNKNKCDEPRFSKISPWGYGYKSCIEWSYFYNNFSKVLFFQCNECKELYYVRAGSVGRMRYSGGSQLHYSNKVFNCIIIDTFFHINNNWILPCLQGWR